jgi:hypothetical protein
MPSDTKWPRRIDREQHALDPWHIHDVKLQRTLAPGIDPCVAVSFTQALDDCAVEHVPHDEVSGEWGSALRWKLTASLLAGHSRASGIPVAVRVDQCIELTEIEREDRPPPRRRKDIRAGNLAYGLPVCAQASIFEPALARLQALLVGAPEPAWLGSNLSWLAGRQGSAPLTHALQMADAR